MSGYSNFIVSYTERLVIFVGLIFCGLESSDNFVVYIFVVHLL